MWEYIYLKIRSQQDKQCVYSVALWRVRVTIVVIEMQQCVLCLLLSYMSHNHIECCTNMFYGEFISLATTNLIAFFL
jgi:hypothetical protein